MSSRSSLYRYIFHGRRLNLLPENQGVLDVIGLTLNSDWASFNKGQALSVGKTTCLRVTLPNTSETVYFKRYKYRNTWEFFLRRSKAANEAINYGYFKNIGIPTLESLALYEQRSFGRLEIACIITKGIDNTQQLDDFYTDVLLNMPPAEYQRIWTSIQEQLFQQIQTAHRAGIFHLDLKWRNILIERKGDEYTPIWIDCPRGVKRRFLNYRLKVADLSGLTRKALSFFTPQQLYKMLYLYLGKDAKKEEARKLFFDISQHLKRRPTRSMK